MRTAWRDLLKKTKRPAERFRCWSGFLEVVQQNHMKTQCIHTWHDMTWRYVTLRYVALRCVALHYITYILYIVYVHLYAIDYMNNYNTFIYSYLYIIYVSMHFKASSNWICRNFKSKTSDQSSAAAGTSCWQMEDMIKVYLCHRDEVEDIHLGSGLDMFKHVQFHTHLRSNKYVRACQSPGELAHGGNHLWVNLWAVYIVCSR